MTYPVISHTLTYAAAAIVSLLFFGPPALAQASSQPIGIQIKVDPEFRGWGGSARFQIESEVGRRVKEHLSNVTPWNYWEYSIQGVENLRFVLSFFVRRNGTGGRIEGEWKYGDSKRSLRAIDWLKDGSTVNSLPAPGEAIESLVRAITDSLGVWDGDTILPASSIQIAPIATGGIWRREGGMLFYLLPKAFREYDGLSFSHFRVSCIDPSDQKPSVYVFGTGESEEFPATPSFPAILARTDFMVKAGTRIPFRQDDAAFENLEPKEVFLQKLGQPGGEVPVFDDEGGGQP